MVVQTSCGRDNGEALALCSEISLGVETEQPIFIANNTIILTTFKTQFVAA
jgi:hypothetical protein